MGLNASVMCNCYRNGLTTLVPFPVEWTVMDDDGHLSLIDQHNTDNNWHQLHQWQQACCVHAGMNYIYEHVANWSEYRQFQEAINEIGCERFPTLIRVLPQLNGGLTTSADCRIALQELDFFNAQGIIDQKTVLVDLDKGAELYVRVGAYDGIFIMAGNHGVNVGLNQSELFVQDINTGEYYFRSSRFQQVHRHGFPILGDSSDIFWMDCESGYIYEPGFAIHGQQIPWDNGYWENELGQSRFEYPIHFQVEQRHRTVQEFSDIVQALRNVFNASVTTENPVRWC